jgi:hypothetical protein
MTTQIEKEISKFDLKNDSVEKIEQFFSKNILGHSRPITDNYVGLYRARKITNTSEEELLTTECIWYRDWNKTDESNHQFNRCSDKGQNLFYGSNDLEAVIKEVNPKDKDIVIVGEFVFINTKTTIKAQYAGIEILKKKPNTKSLLDTFEFDNVNDKIIDEYIGSNFKEKVSDLETYKYKPSIAFTNILLKGDDINCLVYPSVASNLEFANYAIKPEFIDLNMYCKNVYIFSVKRDKTQIEIIPQKYDELISRKANDSKNSKINWKTFSELEKIKETKRYSIE